MSYLFTPDLYHVLSDPVVVVSTPILDIGVYKSLEVMSDRFNYQEICFF